MYVYLEQPTPACMYACNIAGRPGMLGPNIVAPVVPAGEGRDRGRQEREKTWRRLVFV